jgi:hypothetical protein
VIVASDASSAGDLSQRADRRAARFGSSVTGSIACEVAKLGGGTTPLAMLPQRRASRRGVAAGLCSRSGTYGLEVVNPCAPSIREEFSQVGLSRDLTTICDASSRSNAGTASSAAHKLHSSFFQVARSAANKCRKANGGHGHEDWFRHFKFGNDVTAVVLSVTRECVRVPWSAEHRRVSVEVEGGRGLSAFYRHPGVLRKFILKSFSLVSTNSPGRKYLSAESVGFLRSSSTWRSVSFTR